MIFEEEKNEEKDNDGVLKTFFKSKEEKDNNGEESVAEYVEKRNAERNAGKEQETVEKSKKKEQGELDAKTIVQAIPHVATFALGGLAGSTLAPVIEEYRKLKDKLPGKK